MEQGNQQVRTLDPTCRSFDANGRKYIVHDMLTVDGYRRMEELRLEMETGNSAGDLTKMLAKTAGFLQKGNTYDASITVYNALNVAERMKDNRPPAWLLTLTLFVRPEGSDLSAWDESVAESSIQDWEKEGFGIDTLFFFHKSILGTFNTALQRSFHDTSSESSEKSDG